MADNDTEEHPFQDGKIILRKYRSENDPEKLVIHLFDKMNNPEGIAQLRASDHRFLERGDLEVRFVAEFKGELIATLLLNSEYWNKQGYHMYAVVTAEQYRGTGISQLLFKFVCQWAIRQGKRTLTTDTHGNNLRARAFYEKIGFMQFGVIPNNLESGPENWVDHIFYYYLLET